MGKNVQVSYKVPEGVDLWVPIDGEKKKFDTIIFTQPSYNERKVGFKLKDRVASSLVEVMTALASGDEGAKNADKGDKALDPGELFVLLRGSSKFSSADFIETFLAGLGNNGSPICKTPDGDLIPREIFEMIGETDISLLERAVEVYVENFSMPEMFSPGKKAGTN